MKKSWDKKYYKACKKHMDWVVSSQPCVYEGDVVSWVKAMNNLVKEFADDEDYEAAQAGKDAILEFVSKMIKEPIHKEALLVFS